MQSQQTYITMQEFAVLPRNSPSLCLCLCYIHPSFSSRLVRDGSSELQKLRCLCCHLGPGLPLFLTSPGLDCSDSAPSCSVGRAKWSTSTRKRITVYFSLGAVNPRFAFLWCHPTRVPKNSTVIFINLPCECNYGLQCQIYALSCIC